MDMAEIRFKVNGVQCCVGGEVSSSTSLLQFLRGNLQLRGTKYMCLEGGCGACVVTVTKCPGGPVEAVNSCLVSILSCHGWEITTIEKVGNRLEGYHPLQKTLAATHGTQCGYCSPGWIMSMYSLLKSKGKMSMYEIEQSLGSNVCRCTGYRPILEAFKKFAKDAPKPNEILDIEDLTICDKTGKACKKTKCDDADWCFVTEDDVAHSVIDIKLKDGKQWFRIQDLVDIFNILRVCGDDSYMLVNGNTAKGVLPIDEYPRVLIDISTIPVLKGYFLDQNLVIGAGMTISNLTELFDDFATTDYFGYLRQLSDHLKLVAHIPVKNLGTIAGNLMIKHQDNNFTSDLFLIFETVGAQITILNHAGIQRTMPMLDFLKENMRSKVILHVLLPPLSNDFKLVTYKIMPRSQNAHAIVNAGFLYRLGRDGTVIQCRIAYGGLSAAFTRAINTERCLQGKKLFTNESLQHAVKILNDELVVTDRLPATSARYRKRLALGLFYKGLLSLCPVSILNPRYKSGAVNLHKVRPVSSGSQIFDTNPSLWPLNQPIQKVEGLIQCAGEAPFTEDIPSIAREVYAAFVLSTVPLGTIESIDASKALVMPGVIAFYSAKDIPGTNSFMPGGTLIANENEEVLCDGNVKYFNQPIGIIVAETQYLAERASKLVTVKYRNVRKPVIDLKIAKNDRKRVVPFLSKNAKETGSDIRKVIKGDLSIYGQYHFCLETLVCVSRPTEEGIEVHSTTQWIDGVHLMSSRALNIPQNNFKGMDASVSRIHEAINAVLNSCNTAVTNLEQGSSLARGLSQLLWAFHLAIVEMHAHLLIIDVYVRRLGGAYGFKISRPTQVAIACNLVVQKLNRPCRFIQSLRTNMRAVGKRLPCFANYEIAVNSEGVIQYVNYELYEDNGYVISEPLIFFTMDVYTNCYTDTRWNYKSFNVMTDSASNTWCRSPGTLEAILVTEYMMEQIACEMSLDPIQVRLANLDSTHLDPINEMLEKLKIDSQYSERRETVNKFNNENKWKKRGLRFSFMRWSTVSIPVYLDINLSVFSGDGTVVITHSGIEMGQGINTKAVQICAYLLKIPIEKIQIKANNTTCCPNAFISGGSIATQNVGTGVQKCCNELLLRLEPTRKEMNDPTWEELIKKAYQNGTDLQVHGYINVTDNQVYHIYGVALAEVEIDVLTGEYEIIRVDLSEDVGRSISPEIDIGQIEGAFVMGLGYMTSERLVYHPDTGELLTDRSWEYWVPQAKDIPQDFRIYFRKRSYSNDILLGSKATGEPATCLAMVVPLAIREAITSARSEFGISSTEWFKIDGPYTVENVCLAAATRIEDFKFY